MTTMTMTTEKRHQLEMLVAAAMQTKITVGVLFAGYRARIFWEVETEQLFRLAGASLCVVNGRAWSFKCGSTFDMLDQQAWTEGTHPCHGMLAGRSWDTVLNYGVDPELVRASGCVRPAQAEPELVEVAPFPERPRDWRKIAESMDLLPAPITGADLTAALRWPDGLPGADAAELQVELPDVRDRDGSGFVAALGNAPNPGERWAEGRAEQEERDALDDALEHDPFGYDDDPEAP
jgi:hypothetical protein